jgi:hypothetical protein
MPRNPRCPYLQRRHANSKRQRVLVSSVQSDLGLREARLGLAGFAADAAHLLGFLDE